MLNSFAFSLTLSENPLTKLVRMLDVIEIGKQTHKALDGKW